MGHMLSGLPAGSLVQLHTACLRKGWGPGLPAPKDKEGKDLVHRVGKNMASAAHPAQLPLC